MDAEIFKIILESASGTAILALGFWYIISRMRNGKSNSEYVTRPTFDDAVKESRELSATRHGDMMDSIDTWGTKIEAAANTDRQNLFDHVANHD